MKYTKYLIEGDFFQYKNVITTNEYVNVLIILFIAPIALIIFIIVASIIPMMVVYDNGRNVLCILIKFNRKHSYSIKLKKTIKNTYTYNVIKIILKELKY
jgi:hypothetical protein